MGTLTFTGGSITGGTVINDVPGIQMVVGAEGDAWKIENGCLESTADIIQSTTAVPTHGTFYKFIPYVNGYLTVNGQKGYGHLFLMDGSAQIVRTNNNRKWTIDVPLLAGTTYYVFGQNNYKLQSFSYRPAFLRSPDYTSEPDETDGFWATSSTEMDAFPRIIPKDAQDFSMIRFSGDKTVVNLYPNNDVELIGAGRKVTIKGTVMNPYNENTLVASYLLNTDDIMGWTSEFEDQAYVDKSSNLGGDGKYYFQFTTEQGNTLKNFEKTSEFKITVKKDAGAEQVISDATVGDGKINVPFSNLEEGSTYKITVAKKSVKGTYSWSNTGTVTFFNAVAVRTFSIRSSTEPAITMTYPSGLATVGTSIVLQVEKKNDKNIDKDYPVIGYLKKEGETGEGMRIVATYSEDKLIFKPTSTLDLNSNYTLTVAKNQVTLEENNGSRAVIAHDKEFTFKTGTSAGNAPEVTATSPTNDPEGNNPVADYNNGEISFTFNQNVTLEPYSHVYATPVNGSEATANGVTQLTDSDNGTTLKVKNGKTVYFNYSKDELKYDLYYEVVIPANVVVGVGGKPNSEPIKFYFRMAKNPDATAVDAETFYPHTWDFERLGSKTDANSTAYKVVTFRDDPGKGNRNYLITSSNSYTTKAHNDYGFDQGANVYISYKDGTVKKHILPEFEGVRISLVSARSNRFEIRKENGTNDDGTDKYVFRMNGNTHYMTLSNVPAGDLYMVVNTPYLGINSPNAEFSSTEYGSFSNNNTLLDTDRKSKVRITVKKAGDVVFCVKNFNCYQIGVPISNQISGKAKTTKSFSEKYENWVTDCQNKDVRYNLTNTFTAQNVQAYIINGSTYNKETSSVTATPIEVTEAGTGVIIKKISSDTETETPLFVKDYNTVYSSTDGNALKGLANDGATTSLAKDNDNGVIHYIFTNVATTLSKDEEFDKTKLESVMMGYYRSGGGSISAHKSWLDLPTESVNAAKGFVLLSFFDEMEDIKPGIATAIRDVETEPEGGSFYTLDGRKLNGMPNKKGIYVKNGKKILIK